MTNNNHVEEFRRVLETAGLAPAEIVPDGVNMAQMGRTSNV